MKAFKTALKTIRRTPYQALAASLMVMVTFIVVYVVSWLMLGAHEIIKHFETQPQVIAFFELGTTSEEIEAIEKKMVNDSKVKEVKVITQAQALEIYQKENKEDPLLLELVTADILPASIEVSAWEVNSLAEITKQLQSEKKIDDVIYQEDVVETLSSWTKGLETIGIGAIVVLGAISFLTIMVLIGLKATTQKRAIGIMRLIGASRWYVKLPFVIEGMLYGVVGATLGWIISTALLFFNTHRISEFLSGIVSFPLPIELQLAQLAAGVLLGGILGSLAGLVAVSRLMRN